MQRLGGIRHSIDSTSPIGRSLSLTYSRNYAKHDKEYRKKLGRQRAKAPQKLHNGTLDRVLVCHEGFCTSWVVARYKWHLDVFEKIGQRKAQ